MIDFLEEKIEKFVFVKLEDNFYPNGNGYLQGIFKGYDAEWIAILEDEYEYLIPRNRIKYMRFPRKK